MTADRPCRVCLGAGWNEGTPPTTCSACGGSGFADRPDTSPAAVAELVDRLRERATQVFDRPKPDNGVCDGCSERAVLFFTTEHEAWLCDECGLAALDDMTVLDTLEALTAERDDLADGLVTLLDLIGHVEGDPTGYRLDVAMPGEAARTRGLLGQDDDR